MLPWPRARRRRLPAPPFAARRTEARARGWRPRPAAAARRIAPGDSKASRVPRASCTTSFTTATSSPTATARSRATSPPSTPSGARLAARFIDGDRLGVSLRDPHGSAILDGRLYVADLATVRIFYLDDGRPAGDIEIPTATFLNDVVADRVGGRVYVSDSAVLRAADGSLTPNGNDAVYVLDKGVARPFARGRALANPNGLALDGTGALWVADGNGRLYRLAADGGVHDVARGPGTSLDGLVAIGERLLVSDWGTRAVWERGGDGRFTVVVGNVETPADIGWDGKRHRLLIPCIAARRPRSLGSVAFC